MKLRFIIILGLLLLAWNSCRHNETKAPLAKEAYGYARLDTLKQLLTINDETAKDTADAVKTYITTYADFGVGNEKSICAKKFTSMPEKARSSLSAIWILTGWRDCFTVRTNWPCIICRVRR